MSRLVATTYRSPDYLSRLEGQTLCLSDEYKMVNESTRVVDSTGNFIALFQKRVIPHTLQARVHPRFLKGAKDSIANRTNIAGKKTAGYNKLKNGKLGQRYTVLDPVVKAIGGTMGTGGFAKCRPTRWTKDDSILLTETAPLFLEITKQFQVEATAEFCIHDKLMARVKKEHRLAGDAYTSFICNKNVRTGAHRDTGDLKDGVSAITAFGDYAKGELMLPAFNLAFDIRPGDLLLFDPHQLHGNNEIEGERLSTILYSRTDLTRCDGR